MSIFYLNGDNVLTQLPLRNHITIFDMIDGGRNEPYNKTKFETRSIGECEPNTGALSEI